jgi:hypothetical protein
MKMFTLEKLRDSLRYWSTWFRYHKKLRGAVAGAARARADALARLAEASRTDQFLYDCQPRRGARRMTTEFDRPPII